MDQVLGQGLLPADPADLQSRIDLGLVKLTPREQEVFLILGSGAPNRRLAAAMGITERTVKAHIAQILKKFDMGNRSQICIMSYVYQMSLA